MMQNIFVIFNWISLVIIVVSAAKYPIDLPQCRAADTKCLAGVITKILNEHPEGHSGISIPPMEPLRINAIDIVQGKDSPIAIDLKFSDIDLFGISKARITKVIGFESDPESSKFELYATIPRLTLNGDYKINGQILVLPIQGDGKSVLTFDNMNLSIKFKPKVIQKNGKKYIQTDKFMLDFTTAKLSIHFANLFNGDRLLGDNMNTFLNENWPDILAELKPAISFSIEKILESIMNRIFAKFPYEYFYIH